MASCSIMYILYIVVVLSFPTWFYVMALFTFQRQVASTHP